MIEILIFLAIAIFVAVLLRKKRHRPNRIFYPNQLASRLAEIPTIKENLRGIIKNEKLLLILSVTLGLTSRQVLMQCMNVLFLMKANLMRR